MIIFYPTTYDKPTNQNNSVSASARHMPNRVIPDLTMQVVDVTGASAP